MFKSASSNPNFHAVQDITPKDLHDHMREVTIVDVRRPDEWNGEFGHIPGAVLITLDTLPDRIDEIPQDKTVVFVCRSGGRSGQATAFAQQFGYKNVYNMAGGMMAWAENNFETEDRNA